MDIFISWSGARGLAVAEALRDWLPMIINAAKPFLSVADIDKGARWSSEIAGKLEKSKAGIICLTPGNMNSQWILFEAGALSKTVSNTYVCPLLIGLKPSDVKGPLAQFQLTTTAKPDVLQLVKTLNLALGESGVSITQLEKVFERLWPELEEQMKNAPGDEGKGPPKRTAEEMLEEMLELVRNLSRPGTVEVTNIGLDWAADEKYYRTIHKSLTERLAPNRDEILDLQVRHSKQFIDVSVQTRLGLEWGAAFRKTMSAEDIAAIVAQRLISGTLLGQNASDGEDQK